MEHQTARVIDDNGYITVSRNPITKEGVFPYRGSSIPGAEDPNRIYMVYRPAEELCDPECIASFSNLPITDDHPKLMFSQMYGPDSHNLHGTSDQNVSFENGILYSGIRIFTKTLQALIRAGKKALSAGYKCKFIKSSGVFNGLPYDYVQRHIRGNHISLVEEGRSGPDIAVLDHNDLHMAFDSFDLALDQTTIINEGTEMADDDKKTEIEAEAKDNDEGKSEADEGKKEMSLSEVSKVLGEILPVIKEIQDALKGTTEVEVEAAALDEDDDKEKDDKDGKAMDAAEIKGLKERLSKVEGRNPVKEALSQMKGRDALVRDLTPVIGTFDHSDLTVEEVEAYACDKLDIKVPAAQRSIALSGFLKGIKKNSSQVGFAMDASAGPKSDGLLSKRINKA